MQGLPKKKPRTMLPPQLPPTFNRLLKSEKVVDAQDVERAQKLSNDPVEFFRQVVGFEPTEYQVDLIHNSWRTSLLLHAGVVRVVKAGLLVHCCCGMLLLIRIVMLLLWVLAGDKASTSYAE